MCLLVSHSGVKREYQVVDLSRAALLLCCLSGGSTATRLYSTETNHLPPELAKITEAFKSVGDDSLRHKQLLYMANQLPLIAPDKMIPENKVPGCLSTVYIDGSARWSEEKGDFLIDYVGESDGLLTKGLVALLVR